MRIKNAIRRAEPASSPRGTEFLDISYKMKLITRKSEWLKLLTREWVKAAGKK